MPFSLKKENDSYIIAEVGQNHQGDVDIAKNYIKIFASLGADAIKFQTRNNKFLFDIEAYNAPYNSENSFGKTYGEHRESLELSHSNLLELKSMCIDLGVHFISTPFDEPSLELLKGIEVDAIKVSSFDLGNLSFLDKIARLDLPIIMSIGGGKSDQITSSVAVIKKYHLDIALLHCVSEYPCPAEKLGLSNITKLIKKFPEVTVGLSDHYNGILSGSIGRILGATVFEKHVTLNRSNKGTDHNFALEPEGFRKFVRDIKRTPKMLTFQHDNDIGNEPVFKKLGKSIVASKDIKAGEVVSVNNLSGRIFKDIFIPVRQMNEVIGKVALVDIPSGSLIKFKDLIEEKS